MSNAASTDIDRDAAAHQRFIAAARGHWRGPLFAALRREVERETTRRDEDALGRLAGYRVFAWLERHLQRMKYAGPHGLVASAQRNREALLATLRTPLPEGLVSLDPTLQAPAYYTAYDIHQHPGGLAGDALAAFIYREAIASGVVNASSLHERFAHLAVGGRHAQRVLDLGCGFGKSTFAFALAAPTARVEGVDLSASCLMLAAHDAPAALQTRLAFRQADAAATGLPAGAYDIVTSTMLLHEMPEVAVRALIAECGRLVAPGGAVVHLDFLPPRDPLLRLLFAGHAYRNNEPYLLEHSRIDLDEAYAAAGFRSVRVVEFAEEDHALDQPPRNWRLPWHMIVAEK